MDSFYFYYLLINHLENLFVYCARVYLHIIISFNILKISFLNFFFVFYQFNDIFQIKKVAVLLITQNLNYEELCCRMASTHAL